MTTFRKKPVEVQAVRVSELLLNASNNPRAVPWWVRKHRKRGGIWFGDGFGDAVLHVITLNGPVRVESSEWLIRGVEGEIYPCKDEIFQATYEPVA